MGYVNSGFYLLTFMLWIACGCTYANSCINIHDNVDHGYKMMSSVFKVLEDLPIFSCVTECMVVTKCKSINYNNKTRICHLNSEDRVGLPSDVQIEEDFFQSDIANWPRSLAGPCESLACPDDSKCIVNRLNNAQCIPDFNQGCASPSSMTNAVISLEGRYQGAVTTYVCQQDYIFCGTSLSQVCSATGQWEGLGGTCGRSQWTDPALPFTENLPCEMTEDYKIVIEATPIASVRIKTTVRINTLVAIQFDVRFNYLSMTDTSVFASNSNGAWTNEVTTNFPFTIGVRYHVEILRQGGRYEVYLDGAYYGGVTDLSPSKNPNLLIIDHDAQFHNITFTKV